MRFLLGLLMSFLLLNAQTYALSGGPTTSLDFSITGTYSGLLIPSDNDENDLVEDVSDEGSADSLGIFNFAVPETGFGTGTFVLFAQGRTFSGTITGFGDPESGEVSGILQASFNFTVSRLVRSTTTVNGVTTVGFTQVETDVTATVNGNLRALVSAGATNFFGDTSIARIVGTAVLDINQGQVDADNEPIITDTLTYVVDGVQQSTTAVSSTAGGTGTTQG